MRSSVFKLVGGSLLIFAIIWALVLGWWQSNDYEPSRLDLGLYLGALPLALVGGFLLLRGFIDQLKAPPEVPKPADSALRDDDPLAVASAATAAAERAFRIFLIDSQVACAVGDSADDLLEAVAAGKRPEPSPRLADDAGFPVFAAEAQDLETDALQEQLSEGDPALQALAGREDVLRALALLDQVLVNAKEKLNFQDQGQPPLRLNVAWLVPAHWQAQNLVALGDWLRKSYWPESAAADLQLSVQPVAGEREAMQWLDRAIVDANREANAADVTLLLAATSWVGEEVVAQLEASGQLFSSGNQNRRIPGEAAVALVLGSRQCVNVLEADAAASCSRASLGSRDKPADAGGRVSGKLIEQLAAGLLDVSGTESDDVKAAIADTDHRASRMAEVFEGLAGFPHLDPVKDCLATGTVTGDLAPFGFLVALAAAHGKAIADDAAVLCLSNQHELHRAAFLVAPAGKPDDTESLRSA